jgi:hypothetical protein
MIELHWVTLTLICLGCLFVGYRLAFWGFY